MQHAAGILSSGQRGLLSPVACDPQNKAQQFLGSSLNRTVELILELRVQAGQRGAANFWGFLQAHS